MKKFFVYFVIGLLVSIVSSSLYLFLPSHFDTFDHKLRDMLFVQRGKIPTTNSVVIVDIDEKSLKEIGQFPWSRNVVAQMIYNLAVSDVGAIGFDIMFSEPDRTSPKKIINDLGISKLIPKKYKIDYDEQFASIVAQTPTILGYTFDFNENSRYKKIDAPDIPAIFIEQGKPDIDYIPKPNGVIKNISVIQDNAYSSGFFNALPDSDGVIRSVPLLIDYNKNIYPSLSLELIRAVKQTQKVKVVYDELGVRYIQMGDIQIPTDAYGRIYVNFRGPGKTFKYLSASDIILNKFDKKDIEGKIVLIGTSAAGLLDLRNIPYDPVYPGVEVHANVIDNILKGDFLRYPPEAVTYNIAIIAIISFLVSIAIGYSSALFLPFIIGTIGAVTLYYIDKTLFNDGLILSIFYPLFALVFGAIVAIISNYFLEARQKNLIKGKFASKVSPQVMEDIIKNAENGENAFIAKEHEITVTFSDVRNFTNISEAAGSADILIQFLNEYMDEMTNIIMEYEGTVDKFIGDAIMSYWNAPAIVENHVTKAVDATLDQIHAVTPLNEQIKKDARFKPIVEMSNKIGKEPLEIGIGINTGIATIGEMGSKGRSDYTAIGDPINLGARLESLCKYYNSMCNISNHVKNKIDQDKYIFRLLDLVTVKGQSKPIEIWQIHDYRVLPKKWENQPLYKTDLKRLDAEIEYYHTGVKAYHDADFKEALKIFKDIEENWEDKTNKNIYKMYIDRCEHYIENPPKDFNGVFVHTTKG